MSSYNCHTSVFGAHCHEYTHRGVDDVIRGYPQRSCSAPFVQDLVLSHDLTLFMLNDPRAWYIVHFLLLEGDYYIVLGGMEGDTELR